MALEVAPLVMTPSRRSTCHSPWIGRPKGPRRWIWRTVRPRAAPNLTVPNWGPRTRFGVAICPMMFTAVAPYCPAMWAWLVPTTPNAVVGTSAARLPSRMGASAPAPSYASGPWHVPQIRSAAQDRSAAATLPCQSDGSAPAASCAPPRARPISIAHRQTNAKVEGTARRERAPSVLHTCHARAEPASCRVARQTQIARAAIASPDSVPAHSGSAEWGARKLFDGP